jgi:hypothetical protein
MVEWGPAMPFHFLWILGFFMVLFAVGIPLVIIWAVRASGRPAYPPGTAPSPIGMPPQQASPPQRETPLEILQRRFASGEITAEEYQRARDLLGGGKG